MGAIELEADQCFKQAGAIPFKWETRPGVPKPDDHQTTTSHSLPTTPSRHLRLTPPPRTQSLRPFGALGSGHFQLSYPEPDPPLLAQPESTTIGCFLSPRLKWKWGWKKFAGKRGKPKVGSESDRGFLLDSQLTPKSQFSSSFSLYQSSP